MRGGWGLGSGGGVVVPCMRPSNYKWHLLDMRISKFGELSLALEGPGFGSDWRSLAVPSPHPHTELYSHWHCAFMPLGLVRYSPLSFCFFICKIGRIPPASHKGSEIMCRPALSDSNGVIATLPPAPLPEFTGNTCKEKPRSWLSLGGSEWRGWKKAPEPAACSSGFW